MEEAINNMKEAAADELQNTNAAMAAEQEQETVETVTNEQEAMPQEAAQSAEPNHEQPTEAEPEQEAEPEADYSAMGREELVVILNELLRDEVKNIRNRVGMVRTRFLDLNKEMLREAYEKFLADGGNKDDYQEKNDSVAEAFYALYDQYRARRQQYLDAIEAQKKKNLEVKQALIEELRALVDSEEEQVRTALDKFNDIQERWKTVGDVPREKMNDLWQNYHFQIEQFFNKLKINRELRALDQKRNLEQKIQLCEQAEELLIETSVGKAFKTLQDLRAQWKEIGPVPMEQNEEIWQRFQTAAQQIDDRRKEFYEQRKEELNNNLLAKQALVDKATELTENQPQTTREWNDVTAELDELLKIWKTIGAVPRDVNEEIWGKFKGMIDRHYADKKEYFGRMRDEQSQNYQKKLELCLKAEAIAKREDWKKATEELLELQKEWKQVGPTNRKVSEKVWQRFRGACDEFFAKKGEFFKEVRSSESENLAAKEAILKELKEHQFGTDRNENLTVIKEFQRRWAEIGFVPAADNKRLKKEFRDEIDRIFEQLKISAREAAETEYRERIMKSDNIAGIVNNERRELHTKIEKLRSDLALWENNIGFLASSSKQGDLLKREFENKIRDARQQIALLQAKMRILAESEKAAAAAKDSDNNNDNEQQ